MASDPSAAPPVLPPPPTVSQIDNTFGLLYCVTIISAALYGVGMIQGWLYYRKYLHKDPLWTKCLIALVLVGDTIQQGMLCAAMYKYLVRGILNPLLLGQNFKVFDAQIYPSAVIALAVQQFYCYRIFRLSKNNYFVAAPVSIISVGAFVMLCIYATDALKLPIITDLLSLSKLADGFGALSTAADLLISLVMVGLLRFQKTDSAKTTDMLNRLVVFTFNAGLPTSFCATASAIALAAWPTTLWYIFWFLLLGRFYTNSILVSLNSREYIRGGTTHHGTHTSYNLNSIRVTTQSQKDTVTAAGDDIGSTGHGNGGKRDPEQGFGGYYSGKT